jgi:Flp pilus assembly protein TadG
MLNKLKTLIRKPRGQRGQAVVEFAIIVSLFLFLLLHLMEWGFYLWSKTTVENAVREGAREAVVIRDWQNNYTAREAEIKNIVQARLSTLPAQVTNNIAGNITVTVQPNTSQTQSIKVSIANQPYVPITGIDWLIVPQNLAGQAEFRFEGGI